MNRRGWPIRYHLPRERRAWPVVLVAVVGLPGLLLVQELPELLAGPASAGTAAPAGSATPTADQVEDQGEDEAPSAVATTADPDVASGPSTAPTDLASSPDTPSPPASDPLVVTFGVGEVAPSEAGVAALRQLVGDTPGATDGQVGLVVTGYAEPSGDEVLEEQPSLARAQEVAAVLVSLGVPERQVSADAGGAAAPGAPEDGRVATVAVGP
ncbi:hypothetical protein [Aquipuribacter nitratireducens]|uniref:OmpA-like domain-containing protein n=1 Tax=Aquipuribacter nitratireducens TaxID=650104 RepID=A0ABW0GMH5_9MICO